MMFALKPTLIILYTLHTLFTVVLSETITIRVGDGGNRFVPNTVSVQTGDIVQWIWSNSTKGLHSVTQADKEDSCNQLAGGCKFVMITSNKMTFSRTRNNNIMGFLFIYS